MSMEDVWVETVHGVDRKDKENKNRVAEDVMIETTRKVEGNDRQRNNAVTSVQDRTNRRIARKGNRGDRKRAA
jgi:hypothetical protein